MKSRLKSMIAMGVNVVVFVFNVLLMFYVWIPFSTFLYTIFMMGSLLLAGLFLYSIKWERSITFYLPIIMGTTFFFFLSQFNAGYYLIAWSSIALVVFIVILNRQTESRIQKNIIRIMFALFISFYISSLLLIPFVISDIFKPKRTADWLGHMNRYHLAGNAFDRSEARGFLVPPEQTITLPGIGRFYCIRNLPFSRFG